ncbi:S-layer-like proteiny domain-containing protein [Sesbania bispinosa]|nr:S-layer-like proteiny domain-containing protein [Sesbania bispinosa]
MRHHPSPTLDPQFLISGLQLRRRPCHSPGDAQTGVLVLIELLLFFLFGSSGCSRPLPSANASTAFGFNGESSSKINDLC